MQEEEDVEEVMAWPEWGQTIFKVPAQLRREADRGGRPKIATLGARERIVFISGCLRGATGLIQASLARVWEVRSFEPGCGGPLFRSKNRVGRPRQNWVVECYTQVW